MSFSKNLDKTIEQVIHLYAKKISEIHNIEYKELLKLWSDEENGNNSSPEQNKTTQIDNSAQREVLEKMSKAELTQLCKDRGLKVSGSKDCQMARLLGEEEPKPTPKKKSSPPKTKATKKEMKADKVSNTKVIKNIIGNKPAIPVRRNQFGNYEHAETSLIFNNSDRNVIGKQLEDGTVAELTKEDINICNKFKFPYKLPENLDKKGDLDDVKIEELDGDSEEIIEEELESDEFIEEFEYEEVSED